LRGEFSKKTITRREPDQSVAGRRKGHSGKARDGPSHGSESAKGPRERGQELKASLHDNNQEKNQDGNLKSQRVLLKA